MGIIKKIFLVLFLLFVTDLSAQVQNDTIIFDGDVYVKHAVRAGESLKSIANSHKVKTADIINNNEIQKRLYYNQLLYIPVFYNQQENKGNSSDLSIQKQIEDFYKLKDTSVLNIALLMPYFLLRNDTMFNDFEDTTVISDIYYIVKIVNYNLHYYNLHAYHKVHHTDGMY